VTERTWRVPLSDIAISEEMTAAVAETMSSGWWSMGPRVAEFEAAYADFCGARHALAVANGTAALHLALLAAGCGPGKEVVVPSLNFVAAANVIAHTGATPVFCDITSDDDLNLDPDDVASAVTDRTTAVLVLHYGGFPCDMAAIAETAERHGLVILEDAAHAPGSRYGDKMCGTIGQLGCFSFFSNKNLPVGEGGMVVTDDDDLADRVRLLRSHGMTTLTWDRSRGHAHSYDVVTRGFNYRLDEVRAALGLVQLRRLREENSQRARIARQYADALEGVDGVVMPFSDRVGDESFSHHLAVVLLPTAESRDEVRSKLASRRIQTSVHYPPIHQFSSYRDTGKQRPLPRTDDVAGRLLTLPLYAHLSDEQVGEVIEALITAL
jgi:dTDP-4-amino-4,6-dideoxygalactose transaminase